VDDQELIAGTRRLGVAVPRGRHTMCGPSGVGNPSMHAERSIQVHILLINLGVDGSHEVLDLALLAEDEWRRAGVRRIRRGSRGGGRGPVGVERDPGGVVAAVLEAAEAVEEDLEDVAALPRHIVVEVGEDPAHPGRGAGGASRTFCSGGEAGSRHCGRGKESLG